MSIDSIHSWLSGQTTGDGLGRKRWQTEDETRVTSHREPGHVPVDKADAERRARSALSDDGKSDFQRIVEHGFDKFMEELEAQKREKLREKILGEMGLNEKMLEEMTAEQRAEVEKIVAEEMRRRMEAAAEMSGPQKFPAAGQQKNEPGQGLAVSTPPVTAGKTQGMGQRIGLGPLLALQEVDNAKAEIPRADQSEAPGRNDRFKA